MVQAGVGLLDATQTDSGNYVSMPKAKTKIPKFLNRLLGLNMDCQELLFQYFQDTMDATIVQLKSEVSKIACSDLRCTVHNTKCGLNCQIFGATKSYYHACNGVCRENLSKALSQSKDKAALVLTSGSYSKIQHQVSMLCCLGEL